MKHVIKATAPTAYQLTSLNAFGMGNNKTGNGSYWAEKEFETEQDAKAFLATRAELYNDEDPNGSEDRLNDMLNSIMNQKTLTLDAVTAYIEEVEEAEE